MIEVTTAVGCQISKLSLKLISHFSDDDHRV